MKIFECLYENKEWIFSGIGVGALTFIISIIKRIIDKKKKDKNKIVISQVNNGIEKTQIGIQNNFVKREETNE